MEKEFMLSEERIREEIRKKILAKMEEKRAENPLYKKHSSEFDDKLN
jgi:hypothetical protein